MPRLITTLAAAVLLVACGGATPGASTPAGATPAGANPGPTTPGASATAQPTPGGATPTVGPTGGGVIGPVFTGGLAQAFPPVIGGEQVQVFGPLPAPEVEDLDQSTQDLIELLGVDPQSVEVAFATDSGSSVIIFGIRFTGVDSTTIDNSYIAIQEAAPGTSNFRVVTVAGRNVHAFDSMIGTLYAWVNGDILFTVYGSEEGAQQAIAAMPLPTVALQVGGEVLVDALVDVAIDSGPDAGTYHGETSSGGCSRNALGDNQFGLQYSDDANADGLTSVQLVVEDAAAAEAGGTNAFFTTINIGPMAGGSSYEINEENESGSGTVTISVIDNDRATVVIIGQTADGTGIQATVTCNVIFDFSGG